MSADASRQLLERKRARIEALLPLVSQAKRADLRRKLLELESRLGRKPPGYARQSALQASAAGVNGVGGLRFTAKAPPGEGRLLRLPFYLYEMDFNQSSFVAPEVGPMVVTAGGANVVDETHPTVIATMPNDASGRRVLSGFKLRTPPISWAKLRVVGLETTQRQSVYGGNDPAGTAQTPSPLPSSAVSVDLYDVGPGSGATGRYDSFASTLVPPAVVGPTQGGAPIGGVVWLPPGLSYAPQSIDFGRVAIGTTSTIAVTFTEGAGTQRNLVAKTSGDATYTDDATVGVDFIPALGTYTVNISFTPTAAGVVTSSLTFQFQIGPNPPVTFTIPVTGTGCTNNYYRNGNLFLLLRNLSVGGGANLLSQSGFVDGAIYDARLPEFPGLRASPVLESPNRVYIEAAIVGPQLATMTFSASLVCEVLEDSEYGEGVQGPYARGASIARRISDGANVQVK
jgi:hypothetical protein